MIEYLDKEELQALLEAHPEDRNIVIDKDTPGDDLIEIIELGIDSPYIKDEGLPHERENWNGFYDAICDMSWLSNVTVRLIHFGLPEQDGRNQEIYLDSLKDADIDWNHTPKREDCWYPENVGFHVYFLRDLKDEVESVLRRCAERVAAEKDYREAHRGDMSYQQLKKWVKSYVKHSSRGGNPVRFCKVLSLFYFGRHFMRVYRTATAFGVVLEEQWDWGWRVYYGERGQVSDDVFYLKEEEACGDFFRRIEDSLKLYCEDSH